MTVEGRPVLTLPRSGVEKTFEVFSIAALVAMIAAAVGSYSSLPESIPIHFGFDGRPDGWGARGAIFILPGVSLFLYLFMTGISFVPHQFNYQTTITPENAERQYRIARTIIALIKTEVLLLFAVLLWDSIQVALERREGLSPFVNAGLIVSILATAIIGVMIARRKR